MNHPDGTMETLELQLAAAFAVTTGIGFLMLVWGVHKSLLEWRQGRRPCPSCGRTIEGRVCRSCAGD